LRTAEPEVADAAHVGFRPVLQISGAPRLVAGAVERGSSALSGELVGLWCCGGVAGSIVVWDRLR
jgi:hypothetical protein